MAKHLSREGDNRVRRARRKARKRVVSLLCCVTVFCTVYALMLPAITLSEKTNCSLEEHRHGEDCFETRLVCGFDETGHIHDESCIGSQTLLICEEDHEHTEDCYEVRQVLTCELPESETDGEVHEHTDKCYEKILICTLEEHTHSDACFAEPESDFETAMLEIFGRVTAFGSEEEADITALCLDAYTRLCDVLDSACDAFDSGFLTQEELTALENLFDEIVAYMRDEYGFDPYGTAETASVEGVDWGYNDDGSIWWTDPKLVLTTEIREDLAYTIQSNVGSRVMAGREYTIEKDTSGNVLSPAQTGMAADVKPTTASGYKQYQVWYFEKAGAESQYYIYTPDDSGARQYLDMSQPAWRQTNGLSMQLTLETETKTAFYVTQYSDQDLMQIYTVINGNTYYINIAGGSSPYGYFWGWSRSDAPNDSACRLQIGRYSEKQTSNPVATVSPSSTIINLFDYWTTGRWDANDQNPQLGVKNEGINLGHTLQFDTRKIAQFSGKTEPYVNAGTGSTKLTQGIVANTLGDDGYPYLGGTEVTDGSTESLAYLFDTQITQDGKVSFRDVQGLLQVDSQGYFYYDSRYNMAEFPLNSDGTSAKRNSFVVYDKPGVYPNVSGNEGEFFPFNKAPQAAALNANNTQNAAGDQILNHYFGMTVTTRFIQEHGGYTDADREIATSFHFSGDDDVWIFIDGVLVADLGGKHTRVGVTIDFTDGSVSYDNGVASTTLKAAFEAAGKNTATGFIGDTFADNTTHTLKFFYLERGNYDSNLDLKFNLTEIPPTSIYKVDQYGNKLTGAVFAVYPAVKAENGTYRYKTSATDTVGVTLSESAVINETTGVITDGSITIYPAYCDVTNENGDMIFMDEDDALYTMAELHEMFGDRFILREVHIPDGYRTVTDEVYLYTDGSTIFCEDPYKTGVWASPNAMVTATNTLYPVEWDDGWENLVNPQKEDWLANGVRWYDPGQADGSGVTGTLFAVVLKRNEQPVSDIGSWYPIYGNDVEGYTVVGSDGVYSDKDQTYSSQLEAVIETAKKAQDYGGTVFKYGASGMQVTLENLPGDPTRYFNYLWERRDTGQYPTLEAFKNQYASDNTLQYFVAYYYTTESSLNYATVNNTFRVISHSGVKADIPGFSMQWGTTIEVPNLENRLFVQKTDTAGALVDGAVFALYDVYDATPRTESGVSYGYNYIYYNGTDESGSAVWVGLLDNSATPQPRRAIVFGGGETDTHVLGRGDYAVNTATGVITVTLDTLGSRGDANIGDTYTVRPAVNVNGTSLITVTNSDQTYVSEDGTGYFTHLRDGKYYLRELASPPGYSVNSSEIPVLVNANGVYANAGVEDDNVAVGNGVGYLTKTLDVFASAGEIDETLTWVYGALIENDAKDFSAFDAVSGDVLYVGDGTEKDPWQFVTQDENVPDGYGTGESLLREKAMVTYLYYDGSLASSETSSALFDYTPNSDQSARAAAGAAGVATLSGEGTRRLYTDRGWSDMAIYQDYAYGIEQTSTNATTNYTDLTAYGNISNLFSSSTFVRVTDEPSVDLTVLKVDAMRKTTRLEGAEFRVSRVETDADGTETRKYYRLEYGFTGTLEQASILVTDSAGLLTLTDLADGTYCLEELKAPLGYNPIEAPVYFTVSEKAVSVDGRGAAASVTLEDTTQAGDPGITYRLTVPNGSTYELPDTGGVGTQPYLVSGFVLLLAAGAALIILNNLHGAGKYNQNKRSVHNENR